MNARLLAAAAATVAAWSFAIADDSPHKTITPSDNLIADGIPPIPADLVDLVGRYTESRAASFQDWNPMKPEMLITTRFGDTNQVHRVAMPGGARMQLTFFPIVWTVRHSSRSKVVTLSCPKALAETNSIKTFVAISLPATLLC